MVESVGDGEAALAAVEDTRPDVILLDVELPDVDGFEVCRAIILSQIAREPKNDPHARVSAERELNKVEGRHISTVNVKGRLTPEEALGLSRVPRASWPASTTPSP